MEKLTNHEMIANAVKAEQGSELSTSQVWQRVKMTYPGFSCGSLLPNDHAQGNKHPCRCANTDRRIFDKIKHGLYYVR
jgi:hypothetical protein